MKRTKTRGSSKSAKPQFVLTELLERRTLFSVTLFPDVFGTDLVYDATRQRLYTISVGGVNVTSLDVRTGVQLPPVTLPSSAAAAADIAPDGSALYILVEVPTDQTDVLERLDLETNTLTTIPIGARPQFSSSLSGNLEIASDGTAFVKRQGASQLRTVDTDTGAVSLGPGELPSSGGFTVRRSGDRSTVFLSAEETGILRHNLRYDVATGQYTRLRDGVVLEGIVSYDGSLITQQSSVFDRDLNMVTTLPSGEIPAVFDPVRPLLYTYNKSTGHISGFDTSSWAKRTDLDSGVRPAVNTTFVPVFSMADDGSRLFMAGNTALRAFALSPEPAAAGLPQYAAAGVPVSFSVSTRGTDGVDVDWSGRLHFASDDPSATLPPDSTVNITARRPATFTVTFHSAGVHTLEARDIATGLTAGVTTTTVDATPPTASMGYGFPPPPWEYSGPYRINATIVDDIRLDQASIDDRDPELVAIAPDGTVYPLASGVGEPPRDPNDTSVCACFTSGNPPTYYGLRPGMPGTYVVRLLAGAARDVAGNPSAEADLGTVRVGTTEDLAVTLETVPPQPGVAPMVTGTLTINNLGHAPAKGVAHITLSLVPDGPSDTGARELLRWDQRLNLNADRSKRLKLRVGMPADLPDGSYRLVANVAPLSGIARVEPSDDNNTATTPPFQLHPTVGNGQPNLTATVLDPRIGLVEGRPFTRTLQIYNAGGAAANGRYAITLLATSEAESGIFGGSFDQRGFSIVRTIKLPAGATRLLTVRFRAPNDLEAYNFSLSASIVPA